MLIIKATNPLEQCSLKFSNDEKGVFEGYHSVFHSVDKVNDTILPGAFEESLAKGMPKMFLNHDHREVPVGDWLEAKEDNHGLWGAGKIDMNHKDGPTVYSALVRKAMTGLSIGFGMTKDDWEMKDEIRYIKNMNLMETSIVNFPCEGLAQIGAVKSDILELSSIKEVEEYMRDAYGLSRLMAKTFVSQFKSIIQRDAEPVEDELTESLMQSLTNLKGKL